MKKRVILLLVLVVLIRITVARDNSVYDANNDGFIDIYDLNVLLNNFNLLSFNPEADTNQDGVVDLLDLVGVARHLWESAPVCGDGLREGDEQCDDANTVDGDGCSRYCTVESCGNSILEAGEQCDDGNQLDGDGCSSTCRIEGCGNDILEAGEECDDGNLVNGDGCSASCTEEVCSNGVVDYGEQCDDANTNNNDVCKNDCTLNFCGDGVMLYGAEDCDGLDWGGVTGCVDFGFFGGNLACNADCTFDTSGCTSTCLTLGGYVCSDQEICKGSWIPAPDSEYCCSIPCSDSFLPELLIYENFENDLSDWDIMQEESPDKIVITDSVSYLSTKSLLLDYQNPQSYLHIQREFSAATNVLARIFFYDNMDASLGSLFEIKDSSGNYGTGLGVVSFLYPNTYAFRVNSLGNTLDTGITRTSGWHMFEIIITDSGTYAKVDNIILNDFNDLQTNAASAHLVSTWERTGQAYYDELMIIEADTSYYKDQIYNVIENFYNFYGSTDFSGIYPNLGDYHSNDLRSLLNTASVFYIHGKHVGNQDAVNKGKQLLLDAYNYAHWDSTNDWARGVHMAAFARAAYIMWDELDTQTQEGIKQVIFDQAALYYDRMPVSGYISDTKAEENAWHADFLASAVNYFPDIPNRGLLEDKAKCFAYHSITTSNDPEYCGIRTQTVYDDFTLENHNLKNPIYAIGVLDLLGMGAMAYELTGKPVPEEFKHNAGNLYNNFLIPHTDFNTFYPKDTPPLDWSGAHNSMYMGIFTFSYSVDLFGLNRGFSLDDYMSKRSLFFRNMISEWHKEGSPDYIDYFDQSQREHSSYRWFIDEYSGSVYAFTAYMLDR